jgi:hypothetical protein
MKLCLNLTIPQDSDAAMFVNNEELRRDENP